MAGTRIAMALLVTIVWTAIAAFHAREIWPAFLRFNVNELWDILGDKGEELAFFWLVLGYLWLATGFFQQRACLRQTSRLARAAAERAEGAVQRVEAESRKLQDYQDSCIRAAQPRWEVQGCIAHKEQHEINLRNVGAAASNISAIWDRERSMAIVLSNPALVDRGQYLSIKVVFGEGLLDEFDFTLAYCDATGEPRTAHLAVSEMAATIEHQERTP